MLPLVEIFCLIDDFCKYFYTVVDQKALQNPDRKRNRSYTMTLSEIMTILVLFHLSHYRTFKDFYFHVVRSTLNKEFPKLVSYNRFVELMPQAVMPLVILLHCCRGKQTEKYYVDSTKLEVCHNRRIFSHKVFKDIAQRGKTSTGWFFGLKLHLVLNDQGEIIAFTLTPGNTDDRAVVPRLVKTLTGLLFGDRGYISKKLAESLNSQGLELITRVRKGMRAPSLGVLKQLLLKGRGFIETAIGQLKEICQIQHTRHRSPHNFLANLFSGLLAYVFKPKKPSVSWKNHLNGFLLTPN